MSAEFYVIDSSSECSAAPPSPDSETTSPGCGFSNRTSVSMSESGLGVASKVPDCPPVMANASTCTDHEFTADAQSEAALHENITRLASLLPTAAHQRARFGRVEGTHEQTRSASPAPPHLPPAESDKVPWRATLAALKRPRSPPASEDSTSRPTRMAAKAEPCLDDVGAWISPLTATIEHLEALLARSSGPTSAGPSPTTAPICLLSPPCVRDGAPVTRYEPQPVGSSSVAAPVSTLEAEAHLIIDREQVDSLLPLYKELLQLRQERAHAVLDEAAHQKTVLGTQAVLLDELEATCRRELHEASSAFHRRCTTEPTNEYALQSLEEDVRRLQTLRAALGTTGVAVARTQPDAAPVSPHLTPNERREPGRAASAYLRALEATLGQIQQQNVHLQSRLDHLAAANRQLKDRCAASARDTAESAHRAGWVPKEVMLKLLSTRNQSLEAVTKALGWQVVSVSSDEVVLTGESSAHEGERLCVDLTKSAEPVRAVTPACTSPERDDAVPEADEEAVKQEEAPTSLASEPDAVAASNSDLVEEVGQPDSSSAVQHPIAAATDAAPPAADESCAVKGTDLVSEAISHQDTSPTESTDNVRSFSQSEDSGHSRLLEDPGVPADTSLPANSPPFSESGSVNEEAEETLSPPPAEMPIGPDETDEEAGLMDRTDETLVTSMNETGDTSGEADSLSPLN